LLLFLIVGGAYPQTNHVNGTLEVSGRQGQAQVIEIGGRSYVDVQALAQITNGSLSFGPGHIVLTIQGLTADDNSASAPPASVESGVTMSRPFMKAGVEAIAGMREWATTLAYATQNAFPLTDELVTKHRNQAAHDLKLSEVAASTNGDRNAFQLLNHEFEAVQEWSNNLLKARKSLDGKYTASPDALREDPLSQRIISCGHFLSSMLATGSFQDDASCH
jgi:hypothetical protein